MRQVTRKGLLSVAAAGGVLAMSGGAALADSGAVGSAENSPGVLSGNNAQVPVDVPVNVCGNTVNVIGLLNPAMGNRCANISDGGGTGGGGGATAEGGAHNSPGVGSGNLVQVPVSVPVNACGNSVTVVGAGNPAMGNECANISGPEQPEYPENPEHPEEPEHPEHPEEPEHPEQPEHPENPEQPTDPEGPEYPEQPQGPGGGGDDGGREAPGHDVQAESGAELARTGSDAAPGVAMALAAGLLAGGGVLYRRARAGQRG
jgi:hypothetical protein